MHAYVEIRMCSAVVLPGETDAPAIPLTADLTIHADLPLPRQVTVLEVRIDACHAPAVIDRLRLRQVLCSMTEESMHALVRVLVARRVHSVMFWRTAWTEALVHAFATAWPDERSATFMGANGVDRLARVLGDARIFANRPWPWCTRALMPAGVVWTHEAASMLRGGAFEFVDTRVQYGAREFVLRRVRGASVDGILEAALDRMLLWDWLSEWDTAGRTLRLVARGETLEPARTLEDYGLDPDTPLEVCV